MKILAIGDIFGRPGRHVFRDLLPGLIKKYDVDFVIANAENAAGGRGLTPKTADEIFESPVDVLTTGNHIWEHNGIHSYFDSHPILRPHNVSGFLPGKGWTVLDASSGVKVCVISLQGVVYMEEKGPKASNPFTAMDDLLVKIHDKSDIIIVDFHAEATSEKRALGWYLDGRVTAVLGTHTHVQTADEQILSKGTAYISDLGMTGPHESVIGLDKDIAIHRFLSGEKKKFKVAEEGIAIEGVMIDIDDRSGVCRSIERIREKFQKSDNK